MERKYTTLEGASAGLLAGLSVIVLFVVYDAARLTPFATPMELSRVLFGVGGPALGVTESAVSRLTTVATAIFRVLAYTGFHFLVFGGLGVLAARLFTRWGIPANAATGAVYGLTACTVVLFAAFLLVWPPVTTPRLVGVLVANALAGAILGTRLKSAHDRRLEGTKA
jgi:hypothetical protein